MWRTYGVQASCAVLVCVGGLLSACGPESPGEERLARLGQAAIYGEDDRREYGEFDVDHLFERVYLQAANATGALVSRDVIPITSWVPSQWPPSQPVYLGASLTPFTSAEVGSITYPLCEWERYYGQPRLPSPTCTAFLIGADLVATAGHCVEESADPQTLPLSCNELAVVFGFVVDEDGAVQQTLPEDDLYLCAEIVGRRRIQQLDQIEDWAVLRLDRPVVGRSALTLRRSGEVTEGTEVFMVGHGMRLPLKISKAGWVLQTWDDEFYSNFESYPANSGSPVLNFNTGVVEGIHYANNRPHFTLAYNEQGVRCAVSHVTTQAPAVWLPQATYASRAGTDPYSFLNSSLIDEILD
jgi:hypothetical protein